MLLALPRRYGLAFEQRESLHTREAKSMLRGNITAFRFRPGKTVTPYTPGAVANPRRDREGAIPPLPETRS